MSNAVKLLQAAVVTALDAHPAISSIVTGIYDGPPPQARYPYLAVGAGDAANWGSKTQPGRDIRVAINVWDDGDQAARLHDMMAHVEDGLAALPAEIGEWQIATNIFIRSLVSREPAGPWLGLVEQRVRMLSTLST